MKKYLSILALMLCTCLLLIGCETNPSTSDSGADTTNSGAQIQQILDRGKLIVGCKTDVPNLSYFDETTQTWSGLEIELAYRIAGELFGMSAEEAKAQDKVQFQGVTVDNREDYLENGTIDCLLATYTITEERKKNFAFSNSYYTDYIGIMVKKTQKDSNSLGGTGISSIRDLDGKYIGVPRKATTRSTFINYLEHMEDANINPIFCEFESYAQLFDALGKGNIDAMAVDVSILNGYLNSSTTILPDRFGAQHYGAAVKKENIGLLDFINRAIE